MVALDGTETAEPGSHQDEADQIDTVAKAILTALFEDHRFQEMESAWRGLRLLLQQGVSDNASATVSIATVHTQTLAERLDDLTPLIVNDLPNVILLDLPFDNTPLSIERLTAAARWSTTLMVPVIAWVPPAFFQIPKWSRLGHSAPHPSPYRNPGVCQISKCGPVGIRALALPHLQSFSCSLPLR